MKVYRHLDKLPRFNRAVLTIGAFDGVHHGHRQILRRVVDTAKSSSGTSVVLTFHPHPRKVIFPSDDSLRLITTLEEKIALIRECDIEHLIIAPFTVAFSQIHPRDYVENELIQKINPYHLIIGYDHRFGLNREGNIDLLKIYADQGHFSITEIPEREVDDLKVSSTKIRSHLQKGDMALANKLLEKPFRISGNIVHGTKVAGGLGFPTANIRLTDQDKIIPRPGTYAATGEIDGIKYEGMMYIGQRKTLGDGKTVSLEMNIFHHFDQALYDKELTIRLYRFIRPDQYFNSTDTLIRHIQFDQKEVETYFQLAHQASDKTITIAILNWNGLALLKRYLPSVISYSGNNAEILVIDNASTDGSVEYIQKEYPAVKVVRHQRNLGFTGGYNAAMTHIRTPYIIFLNNDVEVSPDWTKPLLTHLNENPTVCAVQPKMRWWQQREKLEYAGAAGGFIDALGYPFCRGRIFNYLETDNGQYDDIAEVFWTSGAAMMVRTDLFIKAGGFDETFFAHQEEIDVCWRLKAMGHRCVCVPQSVVFHQGGSSLSKENPEKTFLNLRNNWKMLLKNEKLSRLAWLIPVRWGLDIVFAVKLLLEGKYLNALAILRAHLDVLRHMTYVMKSRKNIEFIRTRMAVALPNARGRFKIILPVSHFLLRKKTYSDIDL